MTASSVEEKKDWDDGEIEPAPDSSVRPTAPPPPSSHATPVPSSKPSVQIGSIRPIAQSTMSVTVAFSVSPALMAAAGTDGWYLTVTRMDGAVLFEGFLDELGTLDVLVSIPCGTKALKALLESATKYKDAIVAVGDDCTAAHTFV
jgi:hypothetical protein